MDKYPRHFVLLLLRRARLRSPAALSARVILAYGNYVLLHLKTSLVSGNQVPQRLA